MKFSFLHPVSLRLPECALGCCRQSLRKPLGIVLVVAALGALPVGLNAATYTFTDGSGDNAYLNGANWTNTATGTTGTVPNTVGGDLAQINQPGTGTGFAANYVSGPDLRFQNGGELEVSLGSFTQTGGGGYVQLQGTGTILVDGGTFNQGTSTSSPFNVSGTGNVFSMTSGAANFNRGFAVSTGLTATVSGGTLTATGGNLAVSSTGGYTQSGGTASFGAASGSTNLYAIQVNNNSLLTLSGGTLSANGSFSAATGAVVNQSANTTLTVGQGGANFNFGSTFNQTGGTMTVQTGDLTYNGAITANGATTVTAGAISGFGSLTVNGGSITASNGLNLNVSTNPASAANVKLMSGSITIAQDVNIAAGATMTLSGGSLTSTGGRLTNNGALTISGATVSFKNNFIGTGTNTTISGGQVTVSNETDFNNNQNFLTGGTLLTPLITGVNGGGTNADGTSNHYFNISGGVLKLTLTPTGTNNSNGIYGGGAVTNAGVTAYQSLTFTSGSTGLIDFTNGATVTSIQGFITSSAIEFNQTPYSTATGFSNFVFGTDANGFNTLSVVGGAVPEPTTVLGGLLMVGAFGWTMRRQLRGLLAA